MTFSLENVDRLMQNLCNKGLIAVSEQRQISEEQIGDWSEDLSNLQFSLAIDGACTMNAPGLASGAGDLPLPRLCLFSCGIMHSKYS